MRAATWVACTVGGLIAGGFAACSFPEAMFQDATSSSSTASTMSSAGGGGAGTGGAGGTGGSGAGAQGGGGSGGSQPPDCTALDKDGDMHLDEHCADAGAPPDAGPFDDCDDGDDRAFPDQPEYFPDQSKGEGGWDFDCNDITELKYKLGQLCIGQVPCPAGVIVSGTGLCGEPALVQLCAPVTCLNDGNPQMLDQTCH